MSRVHDLKCWPESFAALRDGRKKFEVREDDRGFAVGDVLVLREWDPSANAGLHFAAGEYTKAASLRMLVTYVLYGGRFGLPEKLCVMSLVPAEGEE